MAVSTGLAGTEFLLDRPSLVIGRTPENDIVLNHKSISRHHAKIIRDGDKYIVVDLESANGVRVNGSEFERVELQSGDTVELGHVRLKFSTGNDYIDFDVGQQRRRPAQADHRRCGGGGGAGGRGPGALGGGRKKPEPAVTHDHRPTSERGLGLARSGGRPRPRRVAGPEVQAMLDQAKGAMESENWAAASEAVKRAAAGRPHLGRGGQPAGDHRLRDAGVRTVRPPEAGRGRQELRGSTDAVPDHPGEQRLPPAGGSLERGGPEQAGRPEPDRGRAA